MKRIKLTKDSEVILYITAATHAAVVELGVASLFAIRSIGAVIGSD